jgi:hypothetical protein
MVLTEYERRSSGEEDKSLNIAGMHLIESALSQSSGSQKFPSYTTQIRQVVLYCKLSTLACYIHQASKAQPTDLLPLTPNIVRRTFRASLDRCTQIPSTDQVFTACKERSDIYRMGRRPSHEWASCSSCMKRSSAVPD